MRTIIFVLLLVLILSFASPLFAGQIPSHIYTGANIRAANPSIEKYIAAAPEAYLAGANGPDISNIMSILTKLSTGIGSESHYEKTGDLTIAILENADTDEEKAFALGWMTHWVNDYFVHALVNQWGGWYEVAGTRHKALEMLENKYVYSSKDIKRYNPETVPAAMEQDTYEAVYEAFKKTFPSKSKYTSSGARTDFLLWFRQANGHIRNASKSFMDAAENGTGIATDWITWGIFPYMPTEKQYQDIMKFAEIKDVSFEKGKMIVNITVYDSKLHKWFLKEWDEAQVSATHYSKQVCELAASLLSADETQRKILKPQLSAVLPNVSIDQPRGDFDNAKIFPGNVDAKELYYECRITDTSKGATSFTEIKGTQPIDFSGSTSVAVGPGGAVAVSAPKGFDGANEGVIKLEIPVDTDAYKYELKVSFKGKDVLDDADLKGYAWLAADGVYGATVKIEGDKTVKAGATLKLKAMIEADEKTRPLVKLRWRNETAKTALGDGELLSFISVQKGKCTVKVEAYGTKDGKEIIFGDDAIEIDVTDPDVFLSIEADNNIEPGNQLPMSAEVNAESAIKKVLEIRWTDESGKASYGKGEKIDFSSKQPGSYTIKAEAFWKPDPKSTPVSVGLATKIVTVGAGDTKLRVEGKSSGAPSQAVPLKAILEGLNDADRTGLEFVWTDETRKIGIGKGETANFTADKIGSYEISVEASRKSGDKIVSIAKVSHAIEIAAGEPGKGLITAKIIGLPADAIQGGTIVINADDFRSGGEPYLLVSNDDETGSLALKWSSYWQSTHKAECREAEKQGTPVASIVPPRPTGWGVESIKVVWKSDPVLVFTPADTINVLKTSAKLGDTGKITVWGELYLKTANGVRAEKSGETEKRILAVTPPTITVELKPSKVNLRPGEIAEVKTVVTGGKAPYTYIWTGDHAGDGAVVSTVSRRIGPLPLSVDVTDADGKKGSASVTLKVNGVKAKLVGVENQVVYGTKSKLGNQIEGDETPQNDGLCEKCGQKSGTNKECMLCILAAHDVTKDEAVGSGPFGGGPVTVDPDKAVSIAPDTEIVVPPVAPMNDNGTTGTKPPPKTGKEDPKAPKRMIIWQSEPALTFSPPKSPDGKTTVLYDRVGKVKLWTEILEMKDGVYQTVGETEQVEIDVAPPAFNITFSPEIAKTGQEVKATIKTTPEISAKLLNYVWFNPESSNRMEYDKNGSTIGFKLKDAKPIILKAEARVPYFGDTLSDNVTATFVGSQYLMTTKVTGTKPRIWKEGVGLVDVERAYAVDQNVSIRAEFVDEKPAGEIRYQWTVNEGTSMGSSGLGSEVTVSRHEVGTIEAKVEAKDPDGAPLGRATAVVSITVSADDLKTANSKKTPISIVLNIPKPSIIAGESIKVTAKAAGGVPPYTYFWTGECKGQGTAAVFSSKKVGPQPLTVTVKDSKGTKVSQSMKIDVLDPNLAVKLKIGKTAFVVNEYMNVTAEVTGGRPPYAYKWSPNVEGSGASPLFTAPEPGNITINVTVTDAKKKTASAKVIITVKELEATLEGLPDQTVYGSQISPTIRYPQSSPGSKVNAYPLPNIVWKTVPAIPMRFAQSDGPGNTLTFNRLGDVQVSGEIISSKGKSLGKTPIRTVRVATPAFKVDITKMTGSRAYAKVTAPEGLNQSLVQYKWMRPTTGTVSGAASDMYEFKTDAGKTTDILLVVRTSDTGELLQEIRQQYTADADDKDPGDKTAKSDAPGKTDSDDKLGSETGKVEDNTRQQIEQAETLAANGKIDEAVKLLDKVGNKMPERTAAARKSISRNASAFAGNAVAELDFEKAQHLVDVAIDLDPSSDAAKAKRTEVRKWAKAWENASDLIPEFNDYLDDDKAYSAEKVYLKINEIVGPIPAAPKTGPIMADLSKKWVAARDSQVLRIQPHRRKIIDFIGGNAHENAIPLCEELLDGKVVKQLYPAQEKEIQDWLKLCKAKAKERTASNNSGTKTASGDSGKKKTNTIDKIISGIDNITNTIDKISNIGTTPPVTPKDDQVVAKPNQNPVTTGKTSAGTTYASGSKGDVFNGGTWSNAKNGSDYLQRDFAEARDITAIYIKRAGTDVTTKNARIVIKLQSPGGEWITVDDLKETNINWSELSFGGKGKSIPPYSKTLTPAVRAKSFRLELSGNGWFGAEDIRIVGLGSGSDTRPAIDDKPADPAVASDPVSKPSKVDETPLKPNTKITAPPTGWSKKVLGDIILYVPSIWKTVKALSGKEGAWYTGDEDEPDAGFAVVRQGMQTELPEGMNIKQKIDISVSGLPGRSFIGTSVKGDLIGWLIMMDKPGKDGLPIVFVGVAKSALWSKNKSILEKILGTVLIGKTAQKKTGVPITKTVSKSKTIPPPSKPPIKADTVVTATFVNQASDNIHIFTEGGACDPSNKLTPGETRKVNVRMNPDGRIKFICGRSGTVIESKVWNGDPGDTNRVPKVIFSDSGTLLVTTMLK